MDLLSSVKAREKKRELERLKKLQAEEIFKKPEKAYVPSFKKLTIIFLVLLIIGVTWIMLKSEIVLQNQCGLMPGVECALTSLKSDGMTLKVSNYLKEDLNITLKMEGCEETITNYIRPNAGAEYSFKCSSTGKRAEKKIEMTYVGYSGLAHTKQGWLEGKIEV
jgi:hypothetical protein